MAIHFILKCYISKIKSYKISPKYRELTECEMLTLSSLLPIGMQISTQSSTNAKVLSIIVFVIGNYNT